jgi:SdrD B-like domain
MNKSLKVFLVSLIATASIVGLIIICTLYYFLGMAGNADCVWNGMAKTWIDSNHNGVWDNNEQPLKGIAIHVDDVKNKLINVALPVSTDQNGNAKLEVWLPGCPSVSFEVYADVPTGYQLTTKQRISVNKDFSGNVNTKSVYYFGFMSTH